MDDDEVTIKLCSRGNFLGSQSVSGAQTAQNWHQRGLVCKLNAISGGSFTYVKAYSHYIGSFDSSNQLYVFDVKTGKYRSFSFTNASIVSFCFLCSYADHIGIVFDDNSLCIFDWRTSSVLSTFRVPEATQSVDSIDNQHILLTLSSGKIVMVDLSSRRLVRELIGLHRSGSSTEEPNMSSMAIALAVNPECLFILSPTSGLTAYARENYAPLLQTISKDKSCAGINWKSFCHFSLSSTKTSPENDCFPLIGSDGGLYLWRTGLTALIRRQHSEAAQIPSVPMVDQSEAFGIQLKGKVQLPQEFGLVTSVVYIGRLGATPSKHYLACLTTRGRVLILRLGDPNPHIHDRKTLSWSYSPMVKGINASSVPALLGSSPLPSELHVVVYDEKQSRRYLSVFFGGQLYLFNTEDLHLNSFVDIIFQAVVEKSVFKLPANSELTEVASPTCSTLHTNRISLMRPTENSRKKLGKKSIHRWNASAPQGSKRKESSSNDATERQSLYDLAGLKPKEKRLNSKILRAFLEKHGAFPDKYRPLIWRFLLQLPENTNDFTALVHRGVHMGYTLLKEKFPVHPDRVFQQLQSVCSSLSHWSPIFAEVDYLPSTVFPFLLVYEDDEIAALETVMTLYIWWGHSWFATFPHPPLHIVEAINDLLMRHDKSLYSHITKVLDSDPGLIGWGIISSLFTEIFTKPDWFKVIDFIFAHHEKPQLMIILPVAIMREIRPQLLELSSEMSSSFPFFFRKNLIVDVKRLLSIASSMSTSFSGDSTPTAGLGNSGERLRKAMESDKGEAIFPLPKGHYPLHDGYPLARKDGEAIEVNELLKASNIMLEEKSTILELKERMNECLEDHLEWVERQKQKVLSDTAARDRRAKDEWRHIEDVRKIEKEVLESRVQVMAQIDELARKEIKVLEDLQESKSNGLKSEEDLRSKRRVSEIEIAQLREISEQAELHAHGKILGILRRRSIVDS